MILEKLLLHLRLYIHYTVVERDWNKARVLSEAIRALRTREHNER